MGFRRSRARWLVPVTDTLPRVVRLRENHHRKMKRIVRSRVLWVLLVCAAAFARTGVAQNGPPSSPAVIATIHRLVLTDGSFQEIRRYQIKGDRVRFISAERGGDWEEVPLRLVDWPATLQYARQHTPAGHEEQNAQSEAAVIDQEETAERSEQKSRTPQVLPGLQLPDKLGVWALDYFQNAPELVALQQDSGEMNQRSGHNITLETVRASGRRPREIIIDKARATPRLHIAQPVFYIGLTGGNNEAGPDALQVNTTASKGPEPVSSPDSKYAIVYVWQNVKRNDRVIDGRDVAAMGRGTPSPNVIGTTAVVLPGRHWMKVTPAQRLLVGEYALVEIPAPGQVNASVWDFAIDPQAPDNQDTILPLERGK
jgi:hypothetical protein